MTWPLWFLIARWSGMTGLVAALAGSLVSIGLIPVMLGYQAPIVGLPIPLGRSTPIPNALTVWLDLVIWAALASTILRLLRADRPSASARRAG